MKYLIIGGTSGIGLELAKLFLPHNEVHVTGRHDPQESTVVYHHLDLSVSEGLRERIESVIDEIGKVDVLVYAPGFYQEGTITDLAPAEVEAMLNVGAIAAVWATRKILQQQGELDTFLAITSTSQYTPRRLEPIYTLVKAGLGMYANSLSQDERVKKTLVAGPAGTNTKFHAGRNADMSTYLKPDWVAEQIIAALEEDFAYKYIRILRDPAHVEIVEIR
jgi:NAD(P)-dependent dehydrogenase (short-subunit alcohol dehydrogenase family)